MASLQQFLDVARKEVGYKEGKNNDTKYGEWYGLNYNPWCAMFVSWCADKVGILNTLIPKYSGAGNGYNWFKNKNLITKTPKAGYIGFLKPTKAGATSSHTFIVESVNGNVITTIEGNLEDMCKRNTRKTTDSNILGFGIVELENDGETYYIDNVDYEGANVRYANNGNKTGQILQVGTKVIVYKISGNKAYISDNTYVDKSLISKTCPNYKIVTGADSQGLNVRNKPTTILSKKITILKNGTRVKVYMTKSGWSKVSPNEEAWCSSNFLK